MDLLPSVPLTLNWTITNRCTLSCSHCYSRFDTNEELPVDVLFTALEKVSRWGVLSVNSQRRHHPCGFIPLFVGNVATDDLQEMWDHSVVLGKMRNKVPMGKCSSCRVRRLPRRLQRPGTCPHRGLQ